MTTPTWMRDVSKHWPPDVRDRFQALELSMTRDLMLYICNSLRGYPAAEDGYQVLRELAEQDTMHRADPNKPDSFNSLAHLRLMAIARDKIETDLTSCIGSLRAEGASWTAIANQLHCTRQAAQQRYGKIG